MNETPRKYPVRCKNGHEGTATPGSETEKRCKEHASEDSDAVLTVSSEDCPHCPSEDYLPLYVTNVNGELELNPDRQTAQSLPSGSFDFTK